MTHSIIPIKKLFTILAVAATFVLANYAYENYTFGQSPDIQVTPPSSGTITVGSVNAGILIIKDNSNLYYDGNNTSGTSYTPNGDLSDDTNIHSIFILQSDINVTESSSTRFAGIFASDPNLIFELNGKNITATSTTTGGIAAGFGYASNEVFNGYIIPFPQGSALSDITASSASGDAYGMIFANAAMDKAPNTGVVDIGSNAWITVGKLSATTGAANGIALGFHAGDLASGGEIVIGSIETKHTGTGGATAGILLGNVDGTVGVGTLGADGLTPGSIVGNITGATTVATGFHATELSANAFVEIGTITISSDAANEGYLYGVQINQVGDGLEPGSSTSNTIGTIAGEISVGDITLGVGNNTANKAVGFLAQNWADRADTQDAPGITSTGLVTLSKITINTGSGSAIGVSLGGYDANATNQAAIDLGYAEAGKLVLDGDISVKSANSNAIGVFAGQLKSLDVEHTIKAEGGAGQESYGIYTAGRTETTGGTNNRSVINIKQGAVITGTTKSIRMDSTGEDIVNIEPDGWTNGNTTDYFTLEGVEILNIKGSATFTAGAKRGFASGTDADNTAKSVSTNIASGKTLTVDDTFFEGGCQYIQGKDGLGNLVITNANSLNAGTVSRLYLDRVNATFEAGATLVVTGSVVGEYDLKIIGGSVVTFKRNGDVIAGIVRDNWAVAGNDWNDFPLDVLIDNGTLKFDGTLGSAEAWLLHPFKTTIGAGGATIDIVEDMIVETGKVGVNVVNAVTLTKKGKGELRVADELNLGTGHGTILLQDGTLTIAQRTGGSEKADIKNSPNLVISNSATFAFEKLFSTPVALNEIHSDSNSKIDLQVGTLQVNSGNITGSISGLANGRLAKAGSGDLIISGDNSEMAGKLFQNAGDIGKVYLRSDWGGINKAGSVEQKGGTFVINEHDNDSAIKIYGDAAFESTVELRGRVEAASFKLIGDDSEIVFNLQPLDQDWSELIKTATQFDDATKAKLSTTANHDALLYSRTGVFSDNDRSFDVSYEVEKVEDYAGNAGWTRNIQKIGSLIDSLLAQYGDVTFGGRKIYELENTDADREFLENILVTHLGPELVANSQLLALSNPYYRVFNHLNSLTPMSSASPNYLGQSNNMIRVLQLEYDFWAEGNYQREFVDYDASAWDYDVSRGGLMVGMDVKLGDRMTTGFVFGYGNPHVSNTIGKIAADDIMFGIYSGFRTYFGCTLNTYLGYGVQNFTYKHNLSEATYGGDAAYLSAELSRPFQCGIFGQLTPLFALDYQKTWTDGFITPDTQQIIDKNDLNQFVLRFGLNSKIAPIQQLNIRTRLHYGYQVAGDTFGSATTAFQLNPETKQTLTSVNRGRNRLDIGIGTDLYTFDRRTRFFIDYNFTYGNKATAHTTQFGLVSTR